MSLKKCLSNKKKNADATEDGKYNNRSENVLMGRQAVDCRGGVNCTKGKLRE